ncbi:MAG: threonine/homoserine/homoserine lactone efflux protein [Enterobacterales bacterium]|jgi:threonine/homoserine/homoserine lactone efflux protein
MEHLYPLIFGTIVSMFGFLIPSMLSMTAVRVSLEHDRKSAVLFSLGAASVVFFQGLIAAFFVRFLMNNPEVIIGLKKASIFILLGLAIFFFIEARKKTKIKGKNKPGNSFFIGLGMSSLNQLAIPFYLVMATVAESKGWLAFNTVTSIFYALGTLIGAFIMFYIYVCFAEFISRRNQFIAKNINYILSAFFIILSSITAVKLFI